MSIKKTTSNTLTILAKLVRYNLKIIFSGKFIYFLLAALFIFGFITVLNLFNPESQLTEADMFWLLLVPGVLLIFYPVTFGIQNDVDNRMLEIIFGIPNYRYKVSLVRLLLIFTVSFVMLLLLSLFAILGFNRDRGITFKAKYLQRLCFLIRFLCRITLYFFV